jgi:C-terminal processing protease CtpA/Prc
MGLFHDGTAGEFYSRTEEQLFRVQGLDYVSSQSVPLVLLVGEHTAGFPEILAAGLQAEGRAQVVGGPTAGMVETDSAFYLPDGSRAYIQSTSFRLLSGTEIGLTGIQPDLLVETRWDEIRPDEDPLLEAGLSLFGTAE